MKILANENFPSRAVVELRQAGHDVTWAATDCPSTSDRFILALAREQERTIATLDKDFGALAFLEGIAGDAGVVLFRVPAVPELVARFAVRAFAPPADFRGKFAVVELERIRIRELQR